MTDLTLDEANAYVEKAERLFIRKQRHLEHEKYGEMHTSNILIPTKYRTVFECLMKLKLVEKYVAELDAELAFINKQKEEHAELRKMNASEVIREIVTRLEIA